MNGQVVFCHGSGSLHFPRIKKAHLSQPRPIAIARPADKCYNRTMLDRLPYAENARIDPRKLRDYVLSPEHETGRYKAAFFAQMGYTAENWRRLEADIRAQHLAHPATPGQLSVYGRKYVITAPLRGPQGPARQVTTVWIVRTGSNYAELVTVEPAARQKAT